MSTQIDALVEECRTNFATAIADAAAYAERTADAYSRLAAELTKWTKGESATVTDQDHVARTMTEKMNRIDVARAALAVAQAAQGGAS
jgi:predicted trehalose synthase